MTAISQIPIQPGSFQYGRSLFLIWDVVPVEGGYDYQYAEVPIDADEIFIANILEVEGIEGGKTEEIMANRVNKALING